MSAEEASQPLELLYKEDWKRVGNAAQYMDPNFGYYSLRGSHLIARPPASPSFSGTLVLNAPAIPDFNTVPLPYELVDDAQAILFAMAGTFIQAKG